MRIWSTKKGSTSDHSSTSYEFLAVDKPLSSSDKEEVSKLSRRVSPTSYRASFIYNVEGYDIPDGWENLMTYYYDVMYSEDYGWYTLAMAFNTTKEQYKKLKEFEFRGYEDLGIDIKGNKNRAIVTIYCMLDDEELYDIEGRYAMGSRKSGRDDGLLNFLTEIRQQLIDEDYRSLYVVWENYYDEEYTDFEMVEMPEDLNGKDEGIIYDLKMLLTRID